MLVWRKLRKKGFLTAFTARNVARSGSSTKSKAAKHMVVVFVDGRAIP
jgi:hypothetical protein